MSRIAFVSALDGVPWGGSEELWSRAAAILRDRGHQVFANTHWSPEKPAKLAALEQAGVQLTRRRLRERSRVLDQTLLRGRLAARAFDWLDEVAPKLVVLSLDSQCAGAAWMEECSKRKIPYALIVQAVVEHFWPGDAENALLARGYQSAQRVYCVSHRNLEWLQTQFAHALPQAEVISNPFNVSYDAAPAWPTDSSTLKLACVGRLDPVAKGHDILLRVLEQPKWKSRSISLSFVGEGGYKQSITALAQYCGLTNITFVPFTNDIQGIWQEHNALALASRFEGFPLVVLEAMLCGRPCLVTDVAGNAEMVEDNLSGFVAGAATVPLVDEALERLWQTWKKGDLQQCGKRAADTIRQRVSPSPEHCFADKLEEQFSPPR